MAIARIRKNDTVIVISGTSAGKTGVVKSVDPKKGVAVVEGVNVHKKAVRRTEKTAGGIIDIEMPIRLSKLMPYDAEAKRGWCPYCNTEFLIETALRGTVTIEGESIDDKLKNAEQLWKFGERWKAQHAYEEITRTRQSSIS